MCPPPTPAPAQRNPFKSLASHTRIGKSWFSLLVQCVPATPASFPGLKKIMLVPAPRPLHILCPLSEAHSSLSLINSVFPSHTQLKSSGKLFHTLEIQVFFKGCFLVLLHRTYVYFLVLLFSLFRICLHH